MPLSDAYDAEFYMERARERIGGEFHLRRVCMVNSLLLVSFVLACSGGYRGVKYRRVENVEPRVSFEVRLVDVLFEYDNDGGMQERHNIRNEVVITNSDIEYTEVRKVMGGLGKEEYVVVVTLNDGGRKTFADLTAKNISKKLAFIIDGEVVSLPIILVPILDGRFEITEGYTGRREAEEFARSLVVR
jgi:preprotein translocase subunit SecD